MKKLKKGILFYTSILIISVAIQSCCDNQNITIIGNGEMQIWQVGDFAQDTMRSGFIINLQLETEFSGNFNNLGIINSSYATSCPLNFTNLIKKESLELTCNKDFTFEGTTIESGTNFLAEEKMDLFVDGTGNVEIIINQNYLEDAVFVNGDHEFTIKLVTDDDLNFMNTASTYLKL